MIICEVCNRWIVYDPETLIWAAVEYRTERFRLYHYSYTAMEPHQPGELRQAAIFAGRA